MTMNISKILARLSFASFFVLFCLSEDIFPFGKKTGTLSRLPSPTQKLKNNAWESSGRS